MNLDKLQAVAYRITLKWDDGTTMKQYIVDFSGFRSISAILGSYQFYKYLEGMKEKLGEFTSMDIDRVTVPASSLTGRPHYQAFYKAHIRTNQQPFRAY